MEKISMLLVAGLLACILAVIAKDDKAYEAAYDSLHKKALKSLDHFKIEK
jgi:hypothetical protein